ncbi:MAG: winged helix-turn-helix domain-containing protein [Candidatus Diapherotrites archaeon]
MIGMNALNSIWVKNIVFCLLDSPLIQSQIAKKTGYPQPPVSRILEQLKDEEILEHTKKSIERNEGKKKPRFAWQINFNTLLKFALLPKDMSYEAKKAALLGNVKSSKMTFDKPHYYQELPGRFEEYLKQVKENEKKPDKDKMMKLIRKATYTEMTLETIIGQFLDYYAPVILSKTLESSKMMESDELKLELKEALEAMKLRFVMGSVGSLGLSYPVEI